MPSAGPALAPFLAPGILLPSRYRRGLGTGQVRTEPATPTQACDYTSNVSVTAQEGGSPLSSQHCRWGSHTSLDEPEQPDRQRIPSPRPQSNSTWCPTFGTLCRGVCHSQRASNACVPVRPPHHCFQESRAELSASVLQAFLRARAGTGVRPIGRRCSSGCLVLAYYITMWYATLWRTM